MGAELPHPVAAPATYRSAARTHPGLRRAVNEDRLLDRADAQLWAIADGMGGHEAGEAAARTVIEALAGIEHGTSGYACLAAIEQRIQRANQLLHDQAPSDASRASGSTVVVLLIHEGHSACLWVGDSRGYRLRDGRLMPITRDHSMVQELIDSGALPAKERRGHPQSHVITRAIGIGPVAEIDRSFAALELGDRFLLCSDGLTACLEDEEIAKILNLHPIGKAADALLALALERGAPDNVSLVVIEEDAASTSSPAAEPRFARLTRRAFGRD